MEARVRLLGPPAVRAGGAWLPLRPGRADAVFAFVSRRGAPVRRAEVAALLWPDLDGRRASANLRQTVRTIATGPMEPVVGRDRERVWLDATCDVAAWETAARERRWRDVVAGYRGTFLAGFELDDAVEFASWLEGERASLREQWRHACLAVINDAEQRGDHAEALRVADLVLRSDPLDETVVRHALRASSELGDRAGTRRRFDAFRTLLAQEIGVAPVASTVALAAAAESVTVRAGDAHDDRRPTDTSVPTPAPSVARRQNAREMTPQAARRTGHECDPAGQIEEFRCLHESPFSRGSPEARSRDRGTEPTPPAPRAGCRQRGPPRDRCLSCAPVAARPRAGRTAQNRTAASGTTSEG